MRMAEVLRSRLFAIVAAAVLALVVAGAAAWFVLSPATRSMAGGEALVGGPFTLVDQDGKEVTEEDFAGRFMLIYFGYTCCPDFCPMSLSTMVQAMDLLRPRRPAGGAGLDHGRSRARHGRAARRVRAVVPPPPRGADRHARADRGGRQGVRVYFDKAEDGERDAYLMDHSTFIYLMGPDGGYRRHFGANATPEEMAEGSRAELAEG